MGSGIVINSRNVAKFQSLTAPSLPAVAIVLPSGVNAMDMIQPP
jgi:hypothetical protein